MTNLDFPGKVSLAFLHTLRAFQTFFLEFYEFGVLTWQIKHSLGVENR